MLRKNGKTVGGYNCQTAVDDKHKLIVADDAVDDDNDSGQLEPMPTSARVHCVSRTAGRFRHTPRGAIPHNGDNHT
ncbi:MAG: hypothetical protein OXB95_00390 [Rhodobacteraceae bacterium]|nr:hypothetical protein [Paracoccaceae bacterium]